MSYLRALTHRTYDDDLMIYRYAYIYALYYIAERWYYISAIHTTRARATRERRQRCTPREGGATLRYYDAGARARTVCSILYL